MKKMSISSIVYLMIIAIIVYAFLLVWGNFIIAFIKEKTGWDDSAMGTFKLALAVSVGTVVILLLCKMNPVFILGVDETKLGIRME